MSTFNVRVTYRGEGDLNFHIPVVGEIKIWPGRDIFLEGATVEIVEALRALRPIKVEHTIGGAKKGCYRIIDVNEYLERRDGKFSPYNKTIRKEASSIADIRKELQAHKNDEDKFIPVIEAGTPEAMKDTTALKAEITEPEKEALTEEVEKEAETVETVEIPKEIIEYIVKVGKNKGRKIIDLDKRELAKLARYSTDEAEKEKAKKLIELLYSEE